MIHVRLVGLVEKRSGDVTGAVPEEKHGVGDDFLRVAWLVNNHVSIFLLGFLEGMGWTREITDQQCWRSAY
jgi:hypothetical protein